MRRRHWMDEPEERRPRRRADAAEREWKLDDDDWDEDVGDEDDDVSNRDVDESWEDTEDWRNTPRRPQW